MQADFSVELGRDDPAMELPWASANDSSLRYYDLKQNPEALLEVREALENHELGEFLSSVNSASSILESCKCDFWLSREMSEEEKIYGLPCKFSSYVDLIFSDAARFSLPAHEEFCQALCKLLKRAPEIPCAVELDIRRCYYHEDSEDDSKTGYGITLYLSGYGADETESRCCWNIGINLVQNALLQLSAAKRRERAGA